MGLNHLQVPCLLGIPTRIIPSQVFLADRANLWQILVSAVTLGIAKSGTAQKYTPGVGYTSNKHIALFAGFAPAQNPRVVVVVNIDEPSANGYYGGLVAGPAFQEIMAGSLNVLGVAPTRPMHVAAAKPTQ